MIKSFKTYLVLHKFMLDCGTFRCQMNKKSSSSSTCPQLIHVVVVGPLHISPASNLCGKKGKEKELLKIE